MRPRFFSDAAFGVFAGIALLMWMALLVRAQGAATNQPVQVSSTVVTNPAPGMRPGQAGGGFGGGNNAATEKDHQNMMDQLGIKTIRRGRDGSNTNSPFYANYDEAKANPFPNLPDALTLKNGEKVTTAEMWWQQRRPEIVEDFDREIYGRVPENTPNVNWEVIEHDEGNQWHGAGHHQKTRRPC